MDHQAATGVAGLPEALQGGAAFFGGCAVLVRLFGWRGFSLLRQPILWSLHLAYGVLGVGLVLWGLSLFGFGETVAALHVLGIGAVGGMTLAVMSRAILGHSGRALVAPGPVAASYGLVALAAALRWVLAYLPPELYFVAILTTGCLWIAGYVAFLAALWAALTGLAASKPTDA